MPGSDTFFVAFTDPILLHIMAHQGIIFVVIIFLIALLLFNGHKVQQQLHVYILYCIFIFILFVADVCNKWKLSDRKKNPLDVSRGNFSMTMAPCRYILKRIAKRWQSKNVITSMGLGFNVFCSVSSDKFFVVIYNFLSLVLTIDFCHSQLIFFCILFNKDKKINK